eukprot:Phypoly_transcript_28733.p1 GENE.Phypoly_transcript_28733~~Phypoly_transcript_28733.p1  ORF type:complete len:112 (+),score=2.82 Phypoly_transcript_28733:85-420(+)
MGLSQDSEDCIAYYKLFAEVPCHIRSTTLSLSFILFGLRWKLKVKHDLSLKVEGGDDAEPVYFVVYSRSSNNDRAIHLLDTTLTKKWTLDIPIPNTIYFQKVRGATKFHSY